MEESFQVDRRLEICRNTRDIQASIIKQRISELQDQLAILPIFRNVLNQPNQQEIWQTEQYSQIH